MEALCTQHNSPVISTLFTSLFFLIQCQPVCSAVNNFPMGYPVIQQPPMPATGQPHLDSMSCGLSSCHVVNGIPAPGGFHPIRMNSGNE